MTAWLLDGNMLVALVLEHHEFHARVKRWIEPLRDPFATCAMTQVTLLRLHMKLAADPSPAAAWQVLRRITADALHVFWEDGFSYLEINPKLLHGPKQVTDAWLAELARRRRGKVATLDVAFARLYPKTVELAPVI